MPGQPMLSYDSDMPRSNLRGAFALGLGSSVAAQQVFTNRVTEVAAFEVSVANLDQSLDRAQISPVTDRRAPRTNVLVYFGIGGIGKTTLSSELKRRFTSSQQNTNRGAVRIDLADPGSTNLESYVSRLPAGWHTWHHGGRRSTWRSARTGRGHTPANRCASSWQGTRRCNERRKPSGSPNRSHLRWPASSPTVFLA